MTAPPMPIWFASLPRAEKPCREARTQIQYQSGALKRFWVLRGVCRATLPQVGYETTRHISFRDRGRYGCHIFHRDYARSIWTRGWWGC